MRAARAIGLGWAAAILSACTIVGAPGGIPGTEGPASVSPASTSGAPTTADLSPRAEPAASSGNRPEYRQNGRTYRVLESSEGYEEEGVASWYGREFHGRPTATGERFDMYGLSGAHRTLPLPVYVEVTNLDNGRRLVLRLNDRGPFADTGSRILDVSYGAAVRLGMVESGTARVRVRAVGPPQRRPEGDG